MSDAGNSNPSDLTRLPGSEAVRQAADPFPRDEGGGATAASAEPGDAAPPVPHDEDGHDAASQGASGRPSVEVLSSRQADAEARLSANPDDLDMIRAIVEMEEAKSSAWARQLFFATSRVARRNAGPWYGLVLLADRSGSKTDLRRAAVEVFRRDSAHAATIDLLGPERAEELIRLGRQFRSMDEWLDQVQAAPSVDGPETLGRLAEMIVQYPEYQRAQRAYLELCVQSRNPEAVREIFRRLTPLPDRLPRLPLLVAKAMFSLRQHEDVLDLCAQSLAEYPRLMEAMYLARRALEARPDLRPFAAATVKKYQEKALAPQVLDQLLAPPVASPTAPARPAAPAPAAPAAPPAPPAAPAASAAGATDARLQQARDLELRGHRESASLAYLQWASAFPSYQNFVEAATACERLGSDGRAEWLYSHAIKYARAGGLPEATAVAARERVKRPREGAAASAEGAVNYRSLARQKLTAGDFDTAIGYLTMWAEKAATADAFVEAAQMCSAANRQDFAMLLYKRACSLQPDHPVARQFIDQQAASGQAARSVDVAEIAAQLDIAPDRALELAAKLTGPAGRLTALVALLRKSGSGTDLAWVPPESPAGPFIRWLCGLATDDELVASGGNLEEASRLAYQLAAYEGRWADARRHAARYGGLDLALARIKCGGARGDGETKQATHAAEAKESGDAGDAGNAGGADPLRDLPALEALLSDLLDPTRQQQPTVRRLPAGSLSAGLLPFALQAWEEFQAGRMEDAAFHFKVVGQSPEAGAVMAVLNEAVVLMHLHRYTEAVSILIPLRRRLPREPVVFWAHALCALHLNQPNDARLALAGLLEVEDRLAARTLLAALFATAGRFEEALAMLAGRPPVWANSDASTLLLRCAQRKGPDFLAATIDQLLQGRNHRFAAAFQRPPAPRKSPAPPSGPPADPRHSPAKPTLAKAASAEPVVAKPAAAKPAAAKPAVAEPTVAKLAAKPVAPPRMTMAELHAEVIRIRSAGQEQEVTPFLRQYVRAHPSFVPARLLLAAELRAARLYTQAVNEGKAAVRSSMPGQTAQSELELADTLLEAGRIGEAVELLDGLRTEQLLARPALYRRALDVAESAAQADPTQRGRIALIRLLAADNRAERVVNELLEAVSRRPDDPAVLQAHERYGPPKRSVNLDHARRELDRFIKANQPERALTHVRVLRASRPADPDLRAMEAKALAAAGKDDQAAEVLRQLVQDKGRRDDQLRLAEAYGRLNRTEEMLEEYASLLERDPFDPDVHSALESSGATHLLPGRVADASLLLECSMVYQDRKGESQRRLYRRLLNRGMTDETAGVVRILTERQPDVFLWKKLAEELSVGGGGSTAAGPTVVEPLQPLQMLQPLQPWAASALTAAGVAAGVAAGAPPVDRAKAPAAVDFAASRERRAGAWRQVVSRRPPEEYLRVLDKICPRAAVFAPQDPQGRSDRASDRAGVRNTLREVLSLVREEARRADPVNQVGFLIEAAWIYRLLARLDARPHEHRRRAGPDALDALHEEFESEYLKEVFSALLQLTPPDQSWHPCLEVIEVARGTLPRRWQELSHYLNEVYDVARWLLQLGQAKDVARRKALERDASATCDRLLRQATRRIDPFTLGVLQSLLQTWQDELDRWQQDTARVAQLEWKVSKPEEAGPGAMAVELTITNEAEAVAREVKLEFEMPRQVRVGAVRPVIPPGQPVVVRLVVQGVPADQRAVELVGRIRYKATEKLNNECTIETVLTPPWVRPIALNPEGGLLIQGRPVGKPVGTNDPSYVQRTALLGQIRTALRPGMQANVILIHGLRRMGKSTLLNDLMENPPAGDLPRQINFELLRQKDVRTPEVLEKIGKGVCDTVAACGGTLPLPPIEQWRASPTAVLLDLLDAARPLIGARRVLFLLDEFEILLHKITEGDVDPGFLGFLRGLMQANYPLAFVIVGANRVLDMIGRYHSPLFNLMFPVQVAYFSDEEARRLIETPSRGRMDYDALAVEELIRISGGHPHLLQTLCSDLEMGLGGKRDYVTLLDVKQAVHLLVRKPVGHAAFDAILKESGLEPVEQLILAVIASETTDKNDLCPSRALSHRMADLGCPMSEAELLTTLVKLQTMSIAQYQKRADQSFEYRVSVPLFARWLRLHSSCEDLAIRASRPGADPQGPAEGRLDGPEPPDWDGPMDGDGPADLDEDVDEAEEATR